MKRLSEFIILFMAVSLSISVYAEKKNIEVVVTGNTYSALYPCGHCPASVGGGVARRATVVGQLRKKGDILFVDAGNFTAGGLMDEASAGYAVDRKRTLYYLRVMEKLGYDAVLLGEGDFNFGVDFLKENIKKYKINFVSSNLGLEGVRPYIIKDVGGLKVGLLGLTSPRVGRRYHVQVKDYISMLKENLEKLRPSVDVVVLLSNLDDVNNRKIASRFKGIDLIISSGRTLSGAFYEKESGVPIVRPSYQGKELRIIKLSPSKDGGWDFHFSRKRLSLDVVESPEIKKIIPACISDNDCSRRAGLVARCAEPASDRARCVYEEAERIEAYVITDKQCPFCTTEPTQRYFVRTVPGIHFTVMDYRDNKAEEFIRNYGVATLPAFIISPSIKETLSFSSLNRYLEKRNDMFVARKELSGIFLFLNRKRIPSRMDIFFSLRQDKLTPVIEDIYRIAHKKGWTVKIHFPPASKENGYLSSLEEEEIFRFLAVEQLYPEKFPDYFIRRIKEKGVSYTGIMKDMGIDIGKIDDFIRSGKVKEVYGEDKEFMDTLGINRGFVVLVNNVWVFQVLDFSPEQIEEIFNLS